MSDENTHVRVGLLGPLTVTRGGVPLELGPRQRRVLLVRLLVACGRPVRLDTLCDDLWTGHPPAGAVAAVHAHISRLRRVLEPAAATKGRPKVLTRSSHGYALLLPDRDTARFEQSLARSRSLLEAGQAAAARELVEQALAHWRGPALADAADRPFAVREIARLEENRRAAHEIHIRALLMDGAPEAAAHAARDLVVEEPLRETAWGLLMRALCLLGRPAEAVQQYDRARRMLLDELGVEPGPALRELRREIQHHHSSVADRWARPIAHAC